MSRKRTLNAQQCTDDDVVQVSIFARYVFAFLPCFADREGRLDDKPRALRSAILPEESVDMDALLNELVKANLVIRYDANGRRYIQIRSFAKHQAPHRNEADSVIPEAPPTREITVHSQEFAEESGQLGKLREDSGNGRTLVQNPICQRSSSAYSGSGSYSGSDSGSQSGSSSGSIPDPGGDLPPACDPSAPVPMVLDVLDEAEPELPPVDSYSLIRALKVAMERVHPERGFWDPGSFAHKEADELVAAMTSSGSKRALAASKLLERVREFTADENATDTSVRGFRKWLSRIRASPGAPVLSDRERRSKAAGDAFLRMDVSALTRREP